MSAAEVLAELRHSGVNVRVDGDGLVLSPFSKLAPELKEAVKANRHALLSLLEPQRTPDEGCPDHWRHIPELPAKGEQVPSVDEHGQGTRYRVNLYGAWYILRFQPTVSPTQVRATSTDGKCYELPSMDGLYRTLWAERFRGLAQCNSSPPESCR